MIKELKHINEDYYSWLTQVLKKQGLSNKEINNILYKLSAIEEPEVEVEEVEENPEEESELDPLLPLSISPLDNILKAYKYTDNDGSSSIEFKQRLITIAKAHSAIMDLYKNTLYEDDWDENTIHKFEKLLNIYAENFKYIKENLKDIEWKSQHNKERFFKLYHEIIKADVYDFNRVRARHDNYKRYKTNRKSLIGILVKVIGLPKALESNKDYRDAFDYLNDRCEPIPLYNNKNNSGQPTSEKVPVLLSWLKEHLQDITQDINNLPIVSSVYSIDEVYKIMTIYVKCRFTIYGIFNMFTSNSKYNGWEKYHNNFRSFCDAEINETQMRRLYDGFNADKSLENVDDYHQEMDQITFNRLNIYESLNESWFDEDLDWFVANRKTKFKKSDISKINMIPTNANVCKILCDGKSVYAGTKFYPGDIIEVCPSRVIDKSSLYSNDMRNIAFEVIHNTEWVIPFGYCQYYEPADYGKTANCSYEWDKKNRVIVIRALEKIEKYEKLYLQVFKN